MARTFSGALVPAVNADGSVQWQGWQYDELLQHLTNDLILDNFTPPSSLSWTPTWIPLSLISGFTVSLSGPAPAMLKDPLGVVHLRGRLTTAGASGAPPFNTFPEGYRPGPGDDLYAAGAWNGAAAAVAAFFVLTSAGANGLYYAAGATEVGLGGINFLAEL